MLEVRNLTSPTGRARSSTASIFRSRQGEIVAVMGRNGMGKTTLMKSLIGVMPARVRHDRAWTAPTSPRSPSYQRVRQRARLRAAGPADLSAP